VKRAALLTLLYAGLTTIMAAPWSLHPASRVLLDAPDTHVFLWTLGWDAHAFLNQPFSIFDANIYHPLPNTLAYSENLIGSAFIAAPIIWMTGNTVLAMNLVALLSCLLCGAGTYLLARRLGIGVIGAVLSGVVFAFAPARFFRMSQIHLTTVQWIPFALAYLHAYLETGRARDLRIAIAFATLQVLTAGHGAVFLATAVLALAVYRVALGEPLAVLKRAKDVGITGLLLLVPALLMMLPYRRVQQEMGLRRSLENWTVTPESFLASPSHVHQYVLGWLSSIRFNDAATAFLFPGILPVLLALAAFAPRAVARMRSTTTAVPGLDGRAGTRARLRRNHALFYGALAVLSILLIVDRPFGLWPWVYWWPGMNFIRVPSRFMILTMMCLAVLAGIGFDRIAARWTMPVRRAAGVAVALLLLLEFTAYPFSGVPYTLPAPAIERWLATRPTPFAVAEVPLASPRNAGPFERMQTASMLHSMAHWQKTVHAFSSFRAPLHEKLYWELTHFPDEQSVKSLRELGVTYIVVHTELYSPEEWAAVEPRLADFPGIRLEHQEGAGRVYAVLPAP
jgi:hypothetical protein